MTITTHAVIGAAIGSSLGNPLVGFVAGAASHFLVDMIPHGDSSHVACFHQAHHSKRLVEFLMLDAMLAMLVIIILFNVEIYQSRLTFSLTIIGSILPDALVGLYEVSRNQLLGYYNRFHFFFHNFFSRRVGDMKFRYALILQAIFVLFLIKKLM